MIAHITVTHKEISPDPESQKVRKDLSSYEAVSHVRKGKCFQIKLDETDLEKMRVIVDEICKVLLVNSIYEQYEFTIE